MGKKNGGGKTKATFKKLFSRTEGCATRGMKDCCDGGGGSGSKNKKYTTFEYTEEDDRLEIESRKNLEKFGIKSPDRERRRKSIDKYDFLQTFSKGQQKDSGNDTIDIDITESSFQDRISKTDITLSLGSLNYEPKCSYIPECQGSEYSLCKKSCTQRSRKPECCTTGKKHNKVFYDSNEDGKMEFRSSISFNLTYNEGSAKDWPSNYDADNDDCERVVEIEPEYVKYGKNYYTKCVLTFSQKCIRLKGSSFCDRKTCYLEWPTSDILIIECQSENVKSEVVNLNMKSKAAHVGEPDDWNSGGVELEFFICDDPRWSKLQEEIKSLDPKFEAAWKNIASECIFFESFEDLVYPDGDPDAVFISRRDIDLLQPGTFINDTLIDFYFKYLSDKIKREERHRFHFFNSFFFQKLNAFRLDSSREAGEGDAFQCVRKWTKNVNIFETDYIFIPVNFSLHWSLIIICHPGNVAYLKVKVTDESPMEPCILHMDSIRGNHRGLKDIIRRYLWEEWKERENNHGEEIEMKFLNLKFVQLQLPQQENWFDCGLFLLHYAELFLEQASNSHTTDFFDIEQKYWALVNSYVNIVVIFISDPFNFIKLNEKWFLPAEVSLRKRHHVRKLIHGIVEDYALKDSPAARDDKQFQSPTVHKGDSSVILMEKNSVKESSSVVELDLCNDDHVKGHESPVAILKQSINKSAGDASLELVLPTEQSPPHNGHAATRCCIDTPMQPRWCPYEKRMKDLLETSKISHGAEVTVPTERHGDISEDILHCIVEDSEDEGGVEDVRRLRRSVFRKSPIHFHI